MTLRHRFLVLTLGLSAVLSYGQEFGVDSNTSAGYADKTTAAVTLSQRLDGWYTLPFDSRGGGLELRAHAEADLPVAIAADLDVLSATLVFSKPSDDLKSLKWTLGRFAFGDVTGRILNHPLDGSLLDFDFGSFDVKVTAGFTGLVLRATSGVVLSIADQESTSWFASPRFVGALETGWTFFGAHTLTLGAFAQQDLTSQDKLLAEWSSTYDSTKGGKVDTQYVTLKIDGPLAERLFYDAAFTFEGGTTLSWLTDASLTSVYQYKPITALMGEAGLTYFLPAFLSSSFEARVLVASGDGDATSAVEGNTSGASTLFVPVTATSLGTVFNPGLSNLGFYQLGASMKPVPSLPLVLAAKVLGFQRLVTGVVNAPGVLRLGPLWMGQELDFSVAWQTFSDLQVSASVGAFLPTAGTFAVSPPVQYAAKAGVKISL